MVSAPGEAHHSELKVGLGSFRIKALDPNKKLKIMHACMTVPNVELFCVYIVDLYIPMTTTHLDWCLHERLLW